MTDIEVFKVQHSIWYDILFIMGLISLQKWVLKFDPHTIRTGGRAATESPSGASVKCGRLFHVTSAVFQSPNLGQNGVHPQRGWKSGKTMNKSKISKLKVPCF